MSDHSTHLNLPYIAPAQAQKHVTHNEALRALDVLVQLSVRDADRVEPPVTPAEGDRHIVATAATGDWAGHDGAVTVFEDGIWRFHAPNRGWLALNEATGAALHWTGSAWAGLALEATALNPVDKLGVGTTADAVNRLAVAAEATLLTHGGGDHRLKINKAGSSDTASLLFQSGWTGHAEMGLAGTVDFALRVSADGGTFADALRADAASGQVVFPNGLRFGTDVLQHYETGSWTPRLTFGGGDTGITTLEAQGQFLRIGDLVTVEGKITLSAKGSDTGAAELQDLPFDAAAPGIPGTLIILSGGAGLGPLACQSGQPARIALMQTDSTGASNLTEANFTDSTELSFTLTYRT